MDTTKEQLLGDHIRRARQAMSLSLRKAADRAGISDSRWRQIEKGVQRRNGVDYPAVTTAETLVSIADAVELDAKELLEIAGFPPEQADVVTRTPPAAKSNVIDLNDFPARDAEVIRAFIQGLGHSRKK
ncbi:helix-turn-helix domain-containing protein [Rhodococcoides fascians]|uniref:helix-turn-helix domain-containing protein n=1 Tax=Rhodococcoides fascians TaxID=1828 RepID=UPI000A568BDF|nr:helix-turn-helix transcriptional regulator [Rhodococcus fascians]